MSSSLPDEELRKLLSDCLVDVVDEDYLGCEAYDEQGHIREEQWCNGWVPKHLSFRETSREQGIYRKASISLDQNADRNHDVRYPEMDPCQSFAVQVSLNCLRNKVIDQADDGKACPPKQHDMPSCRIVYFMRQKLLRFGEETEEPHPEGADQEVDQ